MSDDAQVQRLLEHIAVLRGQLDASRNHRLTQEAALETANRQVAELQQQLTRLRDLTERLQADQGELYLHPGGDERHIVGCPCGACYHRAVRRLERLRRLREADHEADVTLLNGRCAVEWYPTSAPGTRVRCVLNVGHMGLHQSREGYGLQMNKDVLK